MPKDSDRFIELMSDSYVSLSQQIRESTLNALFAGKNSVTFDRTSMGQTLDDFSHEMQQALFSAERINKMLLDDIHQKELVRHLSQLAVAFVQTMFQFRGRSLGVQSACTSVGAALQIAKELIQAGILDVCVVGSFDSRLTREMAMIYANSGTVDMRGIGNDEPHKLGIPFHKDRDGMSMSEGAAMLIVESEEHAKARGARIQAELAGVGTGFDAARIFTPDTKQYRASRCNDRSFSKC